MLVFYLFFSIFLFAPVSFAKDSSFTQGSYRTPPPLYKCQLDEECLDHLNHVLLDKEVDRGIYQYCQITYENIKDCCVNPSECQEDWAEGATQDLKDSSLSLVKTGEGALSCELNRLSHLTDSLSGFQAEMCEKGVNNCKVDCEEKLREVRQTFRECFLIPEDSTIEEILKKAETPPTGEEACYNKMKESAEKYKSQSLNKNASLREDLKAKDIVQCEDIKKEKTRASLNDFALNICQIAKNQEEENRQAEEAKIKAEEERRQAEEEKRLEEVRRRAEEAKREESAPQNLAKSAEGDSGSQPRNQQDEEKTANSARAEGTNTNKSAQNQSSSENSKNQASSSKASALLGAGALAALGAKALEGGKSSQSGNSSSSRSSKTESQSSTSQKSSSFMGAKLIKTSSHGSCPVSMPQIQSAVVYQSVEAPQIEPLSRQEFQSDPDNPFFKSYDLVRGKPSGVLIHLDKSRRNDTQIFVLDLTIVKKAGDATLIEKCFHEPLKGQMIKGKESNCFFTKKRLRSEGNYKFFLLSLKESIFIGQGEFDVTVTLYPRGYGQNTACLQQTSFKIYTTLTPDLNLGFAGINGGSNCAYQPAPPSLIKKFVNSDEVKSYIPSMFPIPGSKSKAGGYIDGDCNNILSKERSKTVGILNDIDSMVWEIRRKKYSKIFAIVPRDYFQFHGRPDSVVGTIVSPKWKTWLWFARWKWLHGFLGGSWNVAFVADDQLNLGTVAHELAHLLGQRRDFYKKEGEEEEGEMCQQFRGGTSEPCEDYFIPRGLYIFRKNGEQVLEFKKNMFSIVNNEGDIKTQWIDRETYQKNFLTLSKIGAVAPNDVDVYSESERLGKIQKPAYGLIISGFYNRKENRFIAPRARIQKRGNMSLTPPKIKNKKVPFIRVQLKEGKNLLKEVQYPVLEMEERVFYKNGEVKVFPFPFSHIMTGFYLPQDYKKRKLTIVILDSKGKRIRGFVVPKKKKEKNNKSQSMVLLEKSH